MNTLYDFAKKLHNKTGLKENSVFLCMNIMVWAMFALLVGVVICRLLLGAWEISGIILFCIIGYAAVIFGFFGGAIYLYQK